MKAQRIFKSPRHKALHSARYGKVRKLEKQVYHRNHRIYTGKGPRGSGHQAGEGWGEKKKIDPDSPQRVYSKRGRSPSFDQGVNNYKVRAHNKALTEAKINKFFNK
jgi:hypothetical protein